jgi:hypothetical protein
MREMNRVNSGKPTANVATAILSQAIERSMEGAETRVWILKNLEKVKLQERPASKVDEDIVRYSVEMRRACINSTQEHVHSVHDRRSTSTMKAVVKSTSNGGTLHGQSRAEFCGNANQGVETCAYSYGKKHGVESGEEPGLLNGGHESFSTREGIVRSFEQSETPCFKREMCSKIRYLPGFRAQ